MNKCINCKHCFIIYNENYCGQRGVFICEIEITSCVKYEPKEK